jgi:MtrB/PioB family decaheme-associated outer membrane protein
MTKHTNPYLLSLALAFGLLAVPAMAQENKPQQVSGGVTVGAQAGTGINDSSKLQQYETVPTGVVLFDASFSWLSPSNYFMTFQGNKLGLDDQFAAFQTGKDGAWAVNLSLDQNPRWFSNTARTLYNESAPGVFTLPGGMQSNLQRIWSPASTDPKAPADSNDNRFWSVRDYVDGSQPIDLRYVRKTGLIGVDYTALENWTFKGSYQREVRNGNQAVAFTAGPGIDEIANPIQYTTQDWRAEAEYVKDRYFVNAAFTRSLFHNDVLYSTIDNPVRYDNTDFAWTGAPVVNTNANATARIWNAPDNSATSFDATGGIKLPSHNRVTVTYSRTGMGTDQAFIPQATNPNLNLATTSADYGKFTLTPEYDTFTGRLNQTLFMANLSGNPWEKVGYSLFYRLFDLNDHTPAYIFHSTVNSDGGASYSAAGITSTEDARSFKTGQFRAEAHFTPARGIKVGVNGGQLKNTYEDRVYEDVKDNTVGVTLDANIRWVMLHAGYTHLSRQPGTTETPEPTETPGGRLDVNADMKDIAKQNANIYNVALTLTPIDKVALTFSTTGTSSDFPAVSIGLSKSSVYNYGFDLTYIPTEAVSVSAGYIYEKYHMYTNLWYGANGTATNPVATNTVDKYWNTTDDKVDTFRFGIRWTVVPKKVDVGSDYDYSKGRSDSAFTVTPGGQAGGDMLFPTNTTTVNFTQYQYLTYPQVFNATTIWKTWFDYHLTKDVTLGFLYWRQKFDQADWAYDNLYLYLQPGSTLYASTPGAVANVYPLLDPGANRALVLGTTVPNYNANIFRVSLSYRF